MPYLFQSSHREESTKFVDVGHRGCGANRAVSKSGKKTVISTFSPPRKKLYNELSSHGTTCAGENTLLSFVRAGQLGREAVEFDVQLTKDGVPVVPNIIKLLEIVRHFLCIPIIHNPPRSTTIS